MTMEAVRALPLAGSLDTGTGVDDWELVRRSRAGDQEAFSELVVRHQQVVFNVSYRYMRDMTQAEDMAQEAFLKAYRLLKGFRGECSFRTWMYRVTSSVCLTELNRRKRRGEVEFAPHHDAGVGGDTAAEADFLEQIRRCVPKLSERYATIITLYYLQGISYDEIARTLDIPLGTLKTWMFRARKQLRRIVEKELGGNGWW
ncbi:MAG: RNA polymerase sigma factor [Candidatus Hydrogenedentes bacterium]|nr:RNA polymerase sigma factor [Candidatus Hydrogenedentota bacterium]